jgi:hypothetical protein
MTRHLAVLRHLAQPSMENRIQRLAKERLCRRNTALTAKEKVDRFSLFVDRSIPEGIEPPTRGFSVIFRGFEGFINQSLAASCRPLPRLTKAQSWHTQSELVTFQAQGK